MHLAIRLEYCYGERKTKPSVRVRQLHRKFNYPTVTMEPFWTPGAQQVREVPWPENPVQDNRSADEWKSYCMIPFDGETGHTEYAAELSKIVMSFKEYMGRKNAKGVTAAEILRRGASWDHFQGLQNASRLLTHLGSKGKRLGTGTTRNEQLHMEMKAWGRNIYQVHLGPLQCRLRIFELGKLMTHSSAAYTPTLIQTRQRRLLCSIAGRLRKDPFFPSCMTRIEGFSPTIHCRREDLQIAEKKENPATATLRKQERSENLAKWKKVKRKVSTGKENTTDVFKRRRVSTEPK